MRERKYIRRSPAHILQAVRRMCVYHDIVHKAGPDTSSLDRGAFRRPQDLLPPDVMKRLGEGRRSPSYAYGPEAGDPALRGQIAALQNYRWGTDYTSDHVAMMPGAWAGLYFAVEEILSRHPASSDAPVIAIGPTLYLLFHRMIQFSKVPVAAYDFVIPGGPHVPESMEDMEEIFRKRPRVIFITNPTNPDGRYFPTSLLQETVERAGHEGTFVIIDEIQNCFPHGEKHLQYGPWIRQPHVVRLDSASKRYALAEYRIGWIIADPSLLGTGLPDGRGRMEGIAGRMSGLMGNCSRAANSALSYLIGNEMQQGPETNFLQAVRSELGRKGLYVINRLGLMRGIDLIVLPDACINITAITRFKGNDLELAEMLMQAGTLLMPASGYGYEPQPATLRITFAERMEKLEHSMDTLERVF